MGIDDTLKGLEIIKKDWEGLPKFLKYCYISGGLSLIAAWLLKSIEDQFCIPIYKHKIATTMSKTSFSVFLLIAVAMPAFYWVILHLRIFYYRRRYPIERLHRDFAFCKLGPAIHIIHFKRKEIRWIENPSTAYDLGYYPSAWTHKHEFTSFNDKIQIGPGIIDLNEFRIKPGIRTRREPN
jgi:hypothetical protein